MIEFSHNKGKHHATDILGGLHGRTLIHHLAPTSAHAYKIKKCDPIAEADIALAADYITRRLTRISNQFTHLSAANRKEFRDKWPKVNNVCQDDGRAAGVSRDCLNRTELGGRAHGGLGNKVNICYYNIVAWNSSICDLVNFILHEAGHAHGFPIFANHNNLSASERAQDPVYVMGELAQTFCESDITKVGMSDSPLRGRTDLTNGSECSADDQCKSGLCKGGQCQCDQDSDCASGQSCFKPALGKNYCSATNLALGASCDKNSQCRSDKCEQGECVCSSDGDCGSGKVCKTPITKKNYCEAGDDGNLAIGKSCSKNSQCKSERCQGGSCVCKSDSDCPSSQSCFTPVTKPNYCESTSLPLGASCKKNSQCRSDKCQSGECRCKKDSDCSGSQKCKKPLVGPNWCKS